MPTSFMLQLKNVREVVREGNDEPTGVVVTQVINGLDHANGNKWDGKECQGGGQGGQ